MRRIALIVQGDESLSNRQRIHVNPVRFRTPQELKEVLSSELTHPDGTPMVLPPSATLSFLDPSLGTFQPLVDTSVLTNNSRVRIDRRKVQVDSSFDDGGGGAKHRPRGSKISDGHTLSRQHDDARSGTFDAELAEATVLELLVFHAQVVRLLSAHIRPEREITPQDVHTAVENDADATRAVVNDMWRQKNTTSIAAGGPGLFSSAMSQARIVTQFALQRGATEREASEGDAADRLKETVSVYQRRVDRLEKELADVTASWEEMRQLQLVAAQEKEKAVSDVTRRLEQLEQEAALLRITAANALAHAKRAEEELAVAQGAQQRALLESFLPVDTPGDGIGKHPSAASFVEDPSFLPATEQEEKYLSIVQRGVDDDGSVAHSAAATATFVPSSVRPTTAPATTAGNRSGGGSGMSRVVSKRRLRAASPTAAEDGGTQRTSVHSGGLNAVVRYLTKGSLSARQELVSIADPALHTSVERFKKHLRERCGLAPESLLEVSYVFNGHRQVIECASSLSAFIEAAMNAPPLPGAARGPTPLSISVIELDPATSATNAQGGPADGSLSGCSDLAVVSLSPAGSGVMESRDDSRMDSAADDFSPKTQSQKARVAGARFLGKTLKKEDLLPVQKSADLGSSVLEDQAPGRLSPTDTVVSPTSPLSTSAKAKRGSRLLAAIGRAKSTKYPSPSREDALSTRSLFLYSASVTVPTDDEMKSMFASLAKGATHLDRMTLAKHLIQRYDDVGDASKFLRIAGIPLSHLPATGTVGGTAAAGHRCSSAPSRALPLVDFQEFCMILYRLVRE